MYLSKILKINCVALALMFSTSTFAQTDRRSELNFGLKAGFNYSNVWDEEDDSFEADGRLGFAGGAYLAIPLTDLIGIQPEVMFSQKGFEGTGTYLGYDYMYSVRTNHLDIPILFTLKPAPGVSIYAGPQYSFLLSQQTNFDSELYAESEFERYETDIRKNVLGATVGLDIYIDDFLISPRASWDLTQNHSDGTSSNPRYKNQLVQVTFGYRF